MQQTEQGSLVVPYFILIFKYFVCLERMIIQKRTDVASFIPESARRDILGRGV